MTGLKETFKKEHGERTSGFSLAGDLNGGSSSRFNKASEIKRPSYKAALNAGGHVKFTNGNTHVMVTNENASGSRREKEHHLPVKAVKRYCDLVAADGISGINEKEKVNAGVLSRAVAPYVAKPSVSMKTL